MQIYLVADWGIW